MMLYRSIPMLYLLTQFLNLNASHASLIPATKLADGKCYYIQESSGKFLTYQNPAGFVFADQHERKPFCVKKTGDMTVFLKSGDGFVSANNELGTEAAKQASGWEEFRVKEVDERTFVLGTFHKNYLAMEANTGKLVQVHRPTHAKLQFFREAVDQVVEGESYSIENQFGDSFSIKHQGLASANDPHEYFRVRFINESHFFLQSDQGYYVSADRDDGKITASQNSSGWESFSQEMNHGQLLIKTFHGTYLNGRGVLFHSHEVQRPEVFLVKKPVGEKKDDHRPRIITNSTIGDSENFGRFGNQLLQYIFLKVYAKMHGLEVQTRSWLGQQLYGLKDPEVTVQLPKITDINFNEPTRSKEFYSEDVHRAYQNGTDELVGKDVIGYFQFHTSHHAKEKEYIRSLFKLRADYQEHLDKYIAQLRQNDRTIIVVQIRMGDLVYLGRPYAKPEWYLEWLDKNWSKFHNPVLYIASDSLDVVLPRFEKYKPVSIRDFQELRAEFPKVENDGPDLSNVKPGEKLVFPPNAIYPEKVSGFYPDFHVVMNADVVLVAPSTWTTVLSMLNERAKVFMRADLEKEVLVPFDPWNIRPN